MIIIHILGILLHGSKINKISTGWRIERFLENLHPLIPQSEVIIPSHVLHSSNSLMEKLANEGIIRSHEQLDRC